MKEVAKVIAELARQPDRLRSLEWRQFEELVAVLLAGNGYDVQVTPPTRDGGYDIMAVRKDALGLDTTMLVECKHYSAEKKAGVANVRALKCVKDFLWVSKGIIVTSTNFSQDALKAVQSAYDLQRNGGECRGGWRSVLIVAKTVANRGRSEPPESRGTPGETRWTHAECERERH